METKPTAIEVTFTRGVPDEVIDGLGVIFALAMREMERTPDHELVKPDAVAMASLWLAREKIARVALSRLGTPPEVRARA